MSAEKTHSNESHSDLKRPGYDISSGQPEQDSCARDAADLDAIVYVRGIRYWAIAIIVASLFFLTTIEITITTTSLVAIANNLGDFELVSWILTSYLLGYVAVIVILAKFSDIFGRKSVTIGCIVAFTVFSGGCAAAKTIPQLIVLRAFQGVGGGGSFALSSVLLIESVPPEQYAEAVVKNGVAIILALVLGPTLGGAISENTTWRWIFLINIPIGVPLIVLAAVSIPNGFPYQGRTDKNLSSTRVSSAALWAKVDIPGTLLILLATLAFTACFQEAASRFQWDSAYVITLLVLSVVLWTALLIWERRVTLASQTREPVLPWRFFTDRASLGLFLGFILVGAPVAVANFQLPLRFMLVNDLSDFNAGVRIIPFGGAFAFGTVISGKLASKLRVPSIYLVIIGGVLQVIGFALLGTLSASTSVVDAVYGYQVIAGLGCGLSYTNLIMMVAFTAEKRDGAVALGAANQFRAMGSAIGLAIVTSVFNSHVGGRLAQLGIQTSSAAITAQQMDLPPLLRNAMQVILSEGYNRQMLVLSGFGAAQIPAALLMWKRKQVVVA